jgi:2,4-dienoyl-CoA reductase-like NADH-dependent reductase (Old Yellow Enzyme family)
MKKSKPNVGILNAESLMGERAKLKVFEPKEIGGTQIENRLVRSATFEGMASEDGSITDQIVKLYKTLAEGGVGLIITGLTYVQPSGKNYPHQTGIYKDDLIPRLKKITETVHEQGDGCKIAVQLGHCGRQSFFLEKTIAPSAVFEPIANIMPREMTIEEIEETIMAFAEAARRAKEAGFDAVQLHAAHGYLLSEFLSPYTNRRTDEYGGNTEKRVKIIEDIYNRIVEKVGKDFPILIKMNVDDFLAGGINLNESKKVAEKFSKTGFAAIETSGGMWEVMTRNKEELGWTPAMLPESRINIRSKDKEAYHLSYAREIKKVIDVPLILVGGIRSLDVIEKILAEGSADFIALSRPLIREPDLPSRWLKEIGALTAGCISCNGCVGSLIVGGVRCIPEERKQKSAS